MTALTTRDALAKALHPECGYEHEGYDGPCGHLTDALLASGAVVDAATLADDRSIQNAVQRAVNFGLDDFRMGRASNVEIARRVFAVLAAALTERGAQ